MQIIPLLYLIIIPLLSLLYLINSRFKTYGNNVLRTLNLLVWMYAVYNISILIDIATFLYSWKGTDSDTQFMQMASATFLWKQGLKTLLPFFFLAPVWRNSLLFSWLVLVVFCWSIDLSLLDGSTLFFSIPYCFSLFSATYALLWLFKEHPTQKEV